MNKNFFRVCLVSWGGRKINGGAWMFSLQNGEKTRWNAFFLDWQKCPCASTHGLRLVAFFIFIFIFYNLGVIVVVVVVFFFFDRCDFFLTWFFINKFGWLLSFFGGYLSLFCFNWASFFNNGIWGNLFKLIFSFSPLFHSQPNKNERN